MGIPSSNVWRESSGSGGSKVDQGSSSFFEDAEARVGCSTGCWTVEAAVADKGGVW